MSGALPEQLNSPELELLTPLLTRDSSGWTANYLGLVLRTALQPIYSISHKRVVGYEALIRAFDTDNAPVLPSHLFDLPVSDAENLLLDRLCRYLHIRNYSGFEDQLNWLFLNVSPQVVANGTRADSFFGQLLEKTGLPPHRIVMEIVEQPTDDADRLRETVQYYQKLGCLTAIDDFGAGHSNFERIWNLSPDIVKLDRAMLTRATDDHKARQILNGIVSLLHQSGCLVLLEGVETRDQALIAIDAGVDFVQGFYFSRPSMELMDLPGKAANLEDLLLDYKRRNQVRMDPTRQLTDFFTGYFEQAISSLVESGQSMREACTELLTHPTVSRCYLVDHNGIQLDDTLVSDSTVDCLDPRFRPLESTTRADWYRQHYLRQAIAEPDLLHVTAPYLSVTGASMCVTLSMGFRHQGRLQVLCCDILASNEGRH
ncbi:MAG TPA: EAL domain-containing protein [Marinobacter sp.]|jgi:EAL domain-containing protein (putative c-di-GMP-specific phosphodiesterase class I)|uniref:EAL domain-containing protein n=1 Tax=Marinobacter sp. TaxID=50741 RepID=UPI000EF0219C|nr:EAL domain-containing protein [Marinobacter sp.]MBC7191350.1 EAL domain-containing protein [Marinobacter sp.]HCW89490.1 EAL domain-containing protein [Marinobacter sp.]